MTTLMPDNSAEKSMPNLVFRHTEIYLTSRLFSAGFTPSATATQRLFTTVFSARFEFHRRANTVSRSIPLAFI